MPEPSEFRDRSDVFKDAEPEEIAAHEFRVMCDVARMKRLFSRDKVAKLVRSHTITDVGHAEIMEQIDTMIALYALTKRNEITWKVAAKRLRDRRY